MTPRITVVVNTSSALQTGDILLLAPAISSVANHEGIQHLTAFHLKPHVHFEETPANITVSGNSEFATCNYLT